MELRELNLKELNHDELISITGGDGVFYSIGYGVGWVMGQAVDGIDNTIDFIFYWV